MMKPTTEKRLADVGLLVLRIGIGLMFVGHGLPKILAGPNGDGGWKALAGGVFGTEAPGFFLAVMGLMAGLAEAGGGVLLVLGLFFRPASLIMLVNMFAAIKFHVDKGDGLMRMSHAVEAAILFFALVITGPGKYALGRLIWRSDKSAKPTAVEQVPEEAAD